MLFPEACVLCKKGEAALCTTCLEKLPVFPHAPRPFIYPLFSYHDKQVRTIVHALKYNHTRSLAKILATPLYHMLQDVFRESLSTPKSIVLLPVPAMKIHVNKRGSNHVQMLAEKIANNDNNITVICEAVIRINTKAQRTLARHERLVNMKNAFEVVDEAKIRDAHIVIIDDVCTTGATIDELRTTCFKAGAKSVIAIAIAH